jgi:hypothetical protein
MVAVNTSETAIDAAERPQGLRALWARLILPLQARRDFARARGAFHVGILRQAQERLDAEWHRLDAELQEAQRARQLVVSERDEILVVLLSRHLVHTRLYTVSGIDARTAARIISDVFDGHLEDLRSAQWVIGISEGRQRAVNDWILDMRRQFPELLKDDFPGQREVVAQYRPRLEGLETRVRALQAQLDELVALRECVGGALARLWRVTLADFVAARRNPTDLAARAAVESYTRGVFAEWEPPPEWFRRVCMQPECALDDPRTSGTKPTRR